MLQPRNQDNGLEDSYNLSQNIAVAVKSNQEESGRGRR